MTAWSLVAGFVPVVAFLLGLRIMDTFKLVHRTALLAALAGGFVSALLAYGVNVIELSALHVPVSTLQAWIAPISEEILKAVLVAWLIHTDRVGFVVDAAVLGFGVGAGFAVAENMYYARALHDATITLWLVRGFGTAIMHGSTTATFAVVGKALSDRYPRSGILAFAPGLLCAIVIHAAFNQLSTSPFVTTAVLLIAMPILLLAAFDYSEGVTRGWLADGFDGEMEMLEKILDGEVSDTPVGRYLDALRDRFEPMVVADLFCLLTVHLELSLRAKGMLIARSAGVEVPVDERVRANLAELRHLERVVGATGRLAILPLRRRGRRDLWQILLLEQANAGEVRPRVRPAGAADRLQPLPVDIDRVANGPEAPKVETTLSAEFDFISDLCTVLAEQSDLQPILDWLVKKGTQMLGTDECSIKLIRSEDTSPHTVISKRRPDLPESGTQSWPRMLKDSVLGFLLAQGGELATPDIESDPRFVALRGQSLPARAMVAVPLKVDGRVTGMLAASDRKPGRAWSKVDVQLLSIIASHSAGVIEKARLRVEAEKAVRLELERQAMEKELSVARELQMRLVPTAPMEVGDWQVEGRLAPAREVGGDFYDYFELDGERVVLVIADVTGKGIPAALLVSTVQSALRAFAEAGLEPVRVIEQLNRTVLRSSAAGKFVTMFYAELDRVRGQLRFVNAGHNYPRLRRADGTLEMLQAGGCPLGLFEPGGYQMGEAAFNPGDSLLLFTDGIADAEDAFKQFFTEERQDALWREHGGEAAGAILDRLMGEVRKHRGSTPQADDETAVVVAPKNH